MERSASLDQISDQMLADLFKRVRTSSFTAPLSSVATILDHEESTHMGSHLLREIDATDAPLSL
jgi:hypothetical protein